MNKIPIQKFNMHLCTLHLSGGEGISAAVSERGGQFEPCAICVTAFRCVVKVTHILRSIFVLGGTFSDLQCIYKAFG